MPSRPQCSYWRECPLAPEWLHTARIQSATQIRQDALEFATHLQRRNTDFTKWFVAWICANTGLSLKSGCLNLAGWFTAALFPVFLYIVFYLMHRVATWWDPMRVYMPEFLYLWPPIVPSPRECDLYFDRVLRAHEHLLETIWDPPTALPDVTFRLFRVDRSMRACGNCVTTLTPEVNGCRVHYRVTYTRL